MLDRATTVARRWMHTESGYGRTEVLAAVGVFVLTQFALFLPFIIWYRDRMPRGADGSALPMRRAMAEDPLLFLVVVGACVVAAIAATITFRRVRPQRIRSETNRDVADAAQAAARAMAAAPGRLWESHERATQAASATLLQLQRGAPYEPDRIWVRVFADGVEVTAARSFRHLRNLLWHYGSRESVQRKDAQGRAFARFDGTVTHRTTTISPPR